MTAAVAVLAFAIGAGAGGLHLHVLVKRVGPSYAEWRSADQLGGDWAPFIRLGILVVLLLAIAGTFLPGWFRAAIPAFLFGYCLPFAVEGLRRKAESGGPTP